MPKEELAFVVYQGSSQTDRFVWDRGEVLIGRHADAHICCAEPTMSARHAKIFDAADGPRLHDLGSLNGTQVNGQPIRDTRLSPGDRIDIGTAHILVCRPGDEARDTPGLVPVVEDSNGDDTGQTVRVRLEALRTRRDTTLAEDPRILALRDLFEALRAHEEPELVLAEVRRVLAIAFKHARIFILREDSSGHWADTSAKERPSMSFVIEAARSDSAILSTFVAADQRFSSSESARLRGIQTAIAAPIWCDRKVEAIIYLDRLRSPLFSRRDLHLLGIAANHIAAVLENVARIRALRQTRARLAELNRGLETTVAERTAALRRQAEEIAALAAAKDELLGIAAHDIRGPLTVIQGTVELLRARIGTIDRETADNSLAMVHDITRGLSRLLSELLDAKAIEAGRVHLERRHYRVNVVLGQVMPIARLAAENKNIQVEISAPEGLEVHADARRLAQAITNLVLNAIKFSEPGSRIQVQCQPTTDGGVTIAVEDHGIGIPSDELDQLFGSYTQGEAGRMVGGSGLGLMISKRLVELHGGSLEVTSTVGIGTRFVLAIPG